VRRSCNPSRTRETGFLVLSPATVRRFIAEPVCPGSGSPKRLHVWHLRGPSDRFGNLFAAWQIGGPRPRPFYAPRPTGPCDLSHQGVVPIESVEKGRTDEVRPVACDVQVWRRPPEHDEYPPCGLRFQRGGALLLPSTNTFWSTRAGGGGPSGPIGGGPLLLLPSTTTFWFTTNGVDGAVYDGAE